MVVYRCCKTSYIRWNLFSLWCVFFFSLVGSGSQLYELDSDPERKEFLDDLFVFMQKRGECAPYSSFQFIEHLLSAHCVQVTQPSSLWSASILAQEDKSHLLPVGPILS